MTLIAIIVALVAERLVGHIPGWGTPLLSRGLLAVLRAVLPFRAIWRSAIALPLFLAPPVWLVWQLQDALEDPVQYVFFSGVVLFFCLGPRDLADDVRVWLAARAAGEAQKAEQLSRLLLKGPGRYADDEPARAGLLGALFVQSHERLFGILLWFFAFGAAGAVFYRLVSRLPRLLSEREVSPAVRAAETLHALSAWIPARISAVLFGLSGSLDDALRAYGQLRKTHSHGWRSRTWAILAEVASGSIAFESRGGGTEVPATLDLAAREVINLQLRALLILLAFFAVSTGGNLFS